MEHHWEGVVNPELFGFVYLITNTVTGRMYVGKKQYTFERFFKVEGKERRTRKQLPSGWEFYQGSSKELNRDIKKYGKDCFRFQVLYNCTTRSMLYWCEVREQVLRNVLLERLDGGEMPLYYNRQIAGVKFIPRGEIV